MYSNKNFFELLEIEQSFNLDLQVLEQQYFKAQQKYHPDFAENKIDAMDISSQINAAYKTLKSPETRATYMLKLAGIDILNERYNIHDPELVMEIMDLSEELENLKLPEEIIEFKNKIQQEINKLTRDFNIDNLEDATRLAVKLKYLMKIKSDSNSKLM